MAHQRASDAQDASRLDDRDPYGHTFKLAWPEQLRTAFKDVPASSWVPNGRSGTLLIGDLALNPIRGQMRQGEVRANYSHVRAELVSKRFYNPGPEQLSFELDGDHDDAVAQAHRPQLLVLALADHKYGVRDVCCGQGALEPDGRIVWDWKISMKTLAASQAAPPTTVGLQDRSPAAFGEGPIPEPSLELRPVGDMTDATVGAFDRDSADQGAGDAKR